MGHSGISSRVNDSSRELNGPLSSAGLSSVGSVESSLGLSNLGSVNNSNRGNSGVDWSNGSNSIVHGSNGEVVTNNTESEVISHIVDSVYSGLVHVSVRSLDTTVCVATLLLGRVDVLVSVGKVTELVLGLELAAGGSSHGSSSNSRGSSGHRGSIGRSSDGRGSNGRGSVGWSSDGGSSDGRGSVGSGVLGTHNWGSGGEGRDSSSYGGLSNGTSSQGSSVESCYGSSVCKPSILAIGSGVWCSNTVIAGV